MTEKNSDKQLVLASASVPTTTLTGTRPRRSASEAVEFSVKGPVAVSLDEEEVTSPGCSVLDVQFSTPSQVGELVFRNYYTAWITVLARFNSANNVLLTQGHTNMSHNGGAPQGKIFVPAYKGTASTMKLTEQMGDWVVAIPRRVLMPSPHLENGSHDFISISATESHTEWKNVLTLRLVLRQPSPVWRTFHIEELNVYHDLPRRVPRPVQHSHIIDLVHSQGSDDSLKQVCLVDLTLWIASCQQQYDKLLMLVRQQTVAALHWTPDPKESSTMKDNTGPCGYEFFSLPQI